VYLYEEVGKAKIRRLGGPWFDNVCCNPDETGLAGGEDYSV